MTVSGGIILGEPEWTEPQMPARPTRMALPLV
jgi:hypothetical protein